MAYIPIDPVIDRRGAGVAVRIWRAIVRWFGGPGARLLHRYQSYLLRRALFTLTSEQLRDAGIDPAIAGRGRGAAAKMPPALYDLR